jgi:hypothetical protein
VPPTGRPTSHDPDEPLHRQPVERIEDLRFLRGRVEFVGDLVRDGMLHAAILRSPIAHGRIRRLDTAAARALAGVHAVITATEIGAVPRIPLRLLPLPGTERFLQPVIAADRVRYVGEPIAVVLADSAALAEDGVGAITLDIEELPPVADRRAAGRDGMRGCSRIVAVGSGIGCAVTTRRSASAWRGIWRFSEICRQRLMMRARRRRAGSARYRWCAIAAPTTNWHYPASRLGSRAHYSSACPPGRAKSVTA